MNKRPVCPHCHKQLVVPSGPKDSPWMLVGEFPGKDEIITGLPFVGRTGGILRREFAIQGMDVNAFRMTNLWLHAPNGKKKDQQACDPNFHLTELAKEMKGRTTVLMMGSDLAKTLLGKSIMDVSGLEIPCNLFPGTRLLFSPNPAALMHGPVGEWRLALERLQRILE